MPARRPILQLSDVRSLQGIITTSSAIENAAIICIFTAYSMKLKLYGDTDAETPITHSMLNMFEPITLPMEISICFLNAAATDAASSGRLVPTATTVRPITCSLTPSIDAISDAPRTSWSAPKASMAHDRITSRMAGTNFISFPASCSSVLSSPLVLIE